jgi:phosphoribosylcarboxyaminoimidazole (NCAIR) mutase
MCTSAAPRVGIVMGSDSDLPVMQAAASLLPVLGIPSKSLGHVTALGESRDLAYQRAQQMAAALLANT